MSEALTISLKILGIYIVFSDGFLLSHLKAKIQTKLDKIFGLPVAAGITEPVFNCYVCMSSFWTLMITGFPFKENLVGTMLEVCAINFVISKLYERLTGEAL